MAKADQQFHLKFYVWNILLAIRWWYHRKIRVAKLNHNYKRWTGKGFYEDFNNKTLTEKRWKDHPYHGARNPDFDKLLTWGYPHETREYNSRDGALKLKSFPDYSGKRRKHVGAMLDSVVSHEQMYGYFEINMKFERSTGNGVAFWLVSRHDYPVEIDIFEFFGNKPEGRYRVTSNQHYHLGDHVWRESGAIGRKLNVEKYNTYGCMWTPKIVKIYINGILVRVMKNRCNKPMHIVISTSPQPKGEIPFKESDVYVRWVKTEKYHEADRL